jgi:hypothetical protein
LLRLLRSSKKTNVMPAPNGRQDAQGIATDRLYRSKSRANGRVHGDDEQRRYRSEIERGEIASTLPSITDLTEQTGLADRRPYCLGEELLERVVGQRTSRSDRCAELGL